MKKKSGIIALVIFIFDQLIKIIIDESFYYGILKPVIPNLFYVTKVYNDGAAWSTFGGERYLLIGISIVALIFLFFYQREFQDNKKNALAFGLIYGGLLGNLLDRIRLGYVIDYLKVYIGSYEFPIFNLADVSIVLGFIMLIIAIFKGEDKYGSNHHRRSRKTR